MTRPPYMRSVRRPGEMQADYMIRCANEHAAFVHQQQREEHRRWILMVAVSVVAIFATPIIVACVFYAKVVAP